jgi:hypothetical protein
VQLEGTGHNDKVEINNARDTPASRANIKPILALKLREEVLALTEE